VWCTGSAENIANFRFFAPVRLAENLDAIEVIAQHVAARQREIIYAGGHRLIFGIKRGILCSGQNPAIQFVHYCSSSVPGEDGVRIARIVEKIGINPDLRARRRVLLPRGKYGASVAQNK